MSIWAAIGSLAGGAINQLNQRRAERRQDTSLQRLVADAKKAGISPLAALGSSAAGQYGSPVGSTATGSYVADGLASITPKFDRQLQPLRLENQALQNDLIKAQIAALNSDTVATATSRTRIPAARPSEVEFMGGGDPMSATPEGARMTSGPFKGQYIYKVGDNTYITSGKTSPNELLEGVLGSIPAELAGIQESALNYKTLPRPRLRGSMWKLPGERGARRPRFTPDPNFNY